MHLRRLHRAFAVLIAVLGISTATLFLQGLVAPGVLGCAIIAGLAVWGAMAARRRRPSDPVAAPFGAPKPANAPADGHIRFTLVVEGLEPDRIAEVWSDL